MAVLKVVELMGDSSKSFEDAVRQAVKEAGQTIKGIKSAWIKDQSVVVDGDKVSSYRVVVKITFEVDR